MWNHYVCAVKCITEILITKGLHEILVLNHYADYDYHFFQLIYSIRIVV